jgi:cobalt/nickel transport protein
MQRNNLIFAAVTLVFAVFVALLLAPAASTKPDGLEKVAETHGFAVKANDVLGAAAPMADYSFPGIARHSVAKAAAGFVGTVICFLCVYAIGRCLRTKQDKETGAP